MIALVTSGMVIVSPTAATAAAAMIDSAARCGFRYPRSRHSEWIPAGGSVPLRSGLSGVAIVNDPKSDHRQGLIDYLVLTQGGPLSLALVA